MESTLTLHSEDPYEERNVNFEFNCEGLLQSNYKKVVEETYKEANLKSVFGMRQRLKFSRFVTINHAGVILKLTVFAILFTAIF